MRFLYIDKANFLDEIRVAERTIWQYEIPKRGNKVYFILKRVNRKIVESNNVDSDKIIFTPKGMLLGFTYIILALQVARVIVLNKIDVVVVRNATDLAVVAMLMTKIFGRKLLFIKAYPQLEFQINYKYQNIYAKLILFLMRIDVFILKRSNYLICRTNRYKQYLSEKYGIRRKMISIPMGINVRMLQNIIGKNIPYKTEINGEYFNAVYFGALQEGRNIEFIIDVVEMVVKIKSDFRCYIIGGPEKNLYELNDKINQKGLSHYFVLLKTMPRNELFKLIVGYNICLSPIPPVEEFIISSPTKVVESIALGCPVLGNSEIEDQNYVIQASGGGISIPYDEKLFASELLKIMEKRHLLKKMGEKGSLWVQNNRSYTIMTQNIITYLENSSQFKP